MRTEYTNFNHYKKELENIKDFCKRQKQDWVFCCSGMEGSGKSTLALKTALALDPDFDVRKQTANTLIEYVNITKKYRNKPGKVILFDEAVRNFFSREFSQKANISLVKLFISNRSFQQFNILTIPSFFYLDRYLRQFRLKTVNVSWIKWEHNNKRWFGTYNRKSYRNLLGNAKARTYMLHIPSMVKKIPPNFIAPFKSLKGTEIWEEYKEVKEKAQDDLIDEALEEAMKLQDKDKFGFNTKTPLNEFLRWLSSHYGKWDGNREREYLRFTYKKAAQRAITAKSNIVTLVNELLDKNYIHRLGSSEYVIRPPGQALIKEDTDDE